ncbi:hypothetical protein Tco_0018784 [Tanacetum coccineum]
MEVGRVRFGVFIVARMVKSDDMSGYIVGISKPSNTESKIELIEGLVFDAELLDRILKCLSLLSNVCRPKNRQEHRSGNKKSLQQSSILNSLATWGKDDGITMLVKSMLDGSRPKNRQEHRSGNKKSLQQSSILKSLATWGKDDGITMLVKSMLDGSRLVSLGEGGAVKVLSSFGVALFCDDTIKALEAKHPYKPPPSMSSNTFSEPPLVAEIDSVFGCIKSFLKGVSANIMIFNLYDIFMFW